MHTVDNERGSVLIWMTLMIVLLMIMVGMGLDTSQLTYSRATGQAAVDAAALAAVTALPSGDHDMVIQRATGYSANDYTDSGGNPLTFANVSYAQYNHLTGSITILPDISGANAVRVALEKTNPHTKTAANTEMDNPAFLTRMLNVFGINARTHNPVNVSAVAAIKAVPSIPIAVMVGECKESAKTTPIRLRQTNANIDNSCWTTYTENPPSAVRVQALFRDTATCSGIDHETDLITIGTPLELNNGQQAADYEEAYDLFMNKFPGRCWFVPVVPDGTKCNQTSPLLQWAKICPTDVVKQTKGPEPMYIEATLECNQDLFQAKENLCFSTRLVREPAAGM